MPLLSGNVPPILNLLKWLNEVSAQPSELSAIARFAPPSSLLLRHEQFVHPAIASPRIKVLNWNIAKNNHSDQWLKEFAEILTQYQPDLVFFQEARVDLTLIEPLVIEGMGWHCAPNVMDRDSLHHFGVLTASKVRNLRQTAIHSEHREPVLDTPKSALITEYSLEWVEQTLMAANMHGINFVSTEKFQAQLDPLEAQLRQHTGPIILSGDFNTWNPNRSDRLFAMARRLGLRDVRFSWERDRHRKRFLLSDPLDHIFYRGLHIRPGSADVLDRFESSDHKPMVVEFWVES